MTIGPREVVETVDMKTNPHLQLLSSGQLQLDGYIRVRSEDRGLSEQPTVKIMYADRAGQINSTKIDTLPVRFQGGIGSGFEAVFWVLITLFETRQRN